MADLDPPRQPEVLDVAAVVAHGLLGSMSVVAGAAHVLDTYGERLSDRERRDLIRRLVRHADHVVGVLGDVARGLHPEVHDVLDDVTPVRHRERA